MIYSNNFFHFKTAIIITDRYLPRKFLRKLIALDFLVSKLDYIVMQMRKVLNMKRATMELPASHATQAIL